MDMKIYPAIFTPAPLGGYTVRFYDLPGCRAQGATTEEAAENASAALGEALSAMEKAGASAPAPTPVSKLHRRRDEFCIMVTVDMDEYRETGRSGHRDMPVWPGTGKAYRGFDRKQ